MNEAQELRVPGARREVALSTYLDQPDCLAGDCIRLRADEPYTRTLARAWSAISGPEGEPYLRMFGRLHDTAGEPLWLCRRRRTAAAPPR